MGEEKRKYLARLSQWQKSGGKLFDYVLRQRAALEKALIVVSS